eukprot:51771-Eustigmatos_ZCMA.PRE.1
MTVNLRFASTCSQAMKDQLDQVEAPIHHESAERHVIPRSPTGGTDQELCAVGSRPVNRLHI